MAADPQSPEADRPADDLLRPAFELIAEHGWDGWSMLALAKRAGVDLATLHRALPSREAVLGALSQRVDEAMLGIDPAELEDLPIRDRIFELIMRRLDALAPFKPGLVRLARAARGDPGLVLQTACRLDRSMTWLQELAGLRGHGLRARLQRQLLAALYLRVLQIWGQDETEDLAKTMAELDKQLRRIESMADLLRRRSRSGGPSAQPA